MCPAPQVLGVAWLWPQGRALPSCSWMAPAKARVYLALYTIVFGELLKIGLEVSK